MFGLIYKEIIVHKKQLLGILPVLLFFSGWVIVPPITTADLTKYEFLLLTVLSTITVTITLGMFEQGMFNADELRRWQSYIASTPDGIRNHITSKYIFNISLSFITMTILLLTYGAAGAIGDFDIRASEVVLMLAIWTQIFITAIETPFIIRFGSKYGNYIRMILIALVTFAFIVYGLFGDVSVFGSLEDFLKWANDFINKDSNYVIMLMPSVVLAIYYISYRLSCIFYLKGGEYYDK